MVPSCSSQQHGRPVLGRVRRPRRSPTATLRCRPPTPCPLQPPLRFPVLMASLAAGAWFSAPRGRRHVRPPRAVRRRRVTGSPSRRACVEERRGPPRCTGPSSSSVPWSHTPPETPPSLPRRYVCRGVLWPSGTTGPSASGKTRGFGAACPMAHPFARRRIADHIVWDRRQAGYRLRRAHPWPGGFCTRWTIHEVS